MVSIAWEVDAARVFVAVTGYCVGLQPPLAHVHGCITHINAPPCSPQSLPQLLVAVAPQLAQLLKLGSEAAVGGATRVVLVVK